MHVPATVEAVAPPSLFSRHPLATKIACLGSMRRGGIHGVRSLRKAFIIVRNGVQASRMAGCAPLPSIVRAPPGWTSARTRLAAPSSLRILP